MRCPMWAEAPDALTYVQCAGEVMYALKHEGEVCAFGCVDCARSWSEAMRDPNAVMRFRGVERLLSEFQIVGAGRVEEE